MLVAAVRQLCVAERPVVVGGGGAAAAGVSGVAVAAGTDDGATATAAVSDGAVSASCAAPPLTVATPDGVPVGTSPHVVTSRIARNVIVFLGDAGDADDCFGGFNVDDETAVWPGVARASTGDGDEDDDGDDGDGLGGDGDCSAARGARVMRSMLAMRRDGGLGDLDDADIDEMMML